MKCKRFHNCLWLLVLMLIAARAEAQNSLPSPSQAMAATSFSLREDTLSNGLRYIVKRNPLPAKNIEMRLVMCVGAIYEEPYEKGAAHFLEHMAFAGTRLFPERSLIACCERAGMKYGRDLNAFTGYDRTIYMLSLPIENPEDLLIDSALWMMHDWLTAITIKEERMEREKGVIIEELRDYSVGDDFYDLKMGKNRFSRYLPLGDEAHIRQMKVATLRQFYRKWYHPQLATIVVVGDVDERAIAKKIDKIFSQIPRSSTPALPSHALTYPRGIREKVICDSLLQSHQLEIIIPHSHPIRAGAEGLLMQASNDLLLRLIEGRLAARKVTIALSDAWYLADTDHLVFKVKGRNKKEIATLVARLGSECRGMLEHGFLPHEIAAARKRVLSTYTADQSSRKSDQWCEDFVEYAVSGDRNDFPEVTYRQVQEQLQKMQNKDICAVLDHWLRAAERTTLLAYSKNHATDTALSAEEYHTAWHALDAAAPPVAPTEKTDELGCKVGRTAAKDAFAPSDIRCLSAERPFDSHMIQQRAEHSAIKATELTLSNGLHIILKPTPSADSLLLFNFIGEGGSANLPADRQHLYEGAAGYMEMGGIQKIPRDILSAFTARHSIAMSTNISSHWHEVFASAPTALAGALFNLVYEKMHHPEIPRQDFLEVKKEELEHVGKETMLGKMMEQDPQRLVENYIAARLGEVLENPTPRTHQEIEALDIDSIAHYFSALFANPQGATILLTGTFDIDTIVPLLVATFARMQPSTAAPISNKATLPPATTSHEVHFKGAHPTKIAFDMLLTGHYTPSLRASLRLKLMRDILQNRLLSILREQESIVYSPLVSLSYHGKPYALFCLDLSVSVLKSNIARAQQLLRNIVEELRKKPVEKEELEAIKRSFIVTKRRVLPPIAAADWRITLLDIVKNGETLSDFDHYEAILHSITSQEICETFRSAIQPEHIVTLFIDSADQ